ncbi:MAG TPA: hypothetical protein VK589_15635 [Chryseolinea sp.]|nr:hypothetical protein [Chryseolinea sp.]
MKKNPLTFKTLVTSLTSVDSLSPLFIGMLLFISVLILSSCSKDDDDFGADIAKVVGTYNVTDTDEDDEVENYSVTITKAGNGVEISNFGDIMYVPVKATIKGNSFNIPKQTFQGKSMTIEIYGSGTLNGSKLTFDYTIKTDDDFILEHSCDATKQQ